MTRGEAVARAAEALVGAPFRLHGRAAATGIDCVGLVELALAGAGLSVRLPQGYRLRNRSIAALAASVPAAGFDEVQGLPTPGDVLLVQPGPAQHHLCIAIAADRFIHAHAGLRRVVRHCGALPWPILRHWRVQD